MLRKQKIEHTLPSAELEYTIQYNWGQLHMTKAANDAYDIVPLTSVVDGGSDEYRHMDNFPSIVDRFESDPSLAPVVFLIGRALRGHIYTEKTKIFGSSYQFDACFVPANRALDFFTHQCAAARRAVDVWCLMAVRINSKVNRYIRKKIGMIIWEARELADYAVAESADAGVKRVRVEIRE